MSLEISRRTKIIGNENILRIAEHQASLQVAGFSSPRSVKKPIGALGFCYFCAKAKVEAPQENGTMPSCDALKINQQNSANDTFVRKILVSLPQNGSFEQEKIQLYILLSNPTMRRTTGEKGRNKSVFSYFSLPHKC